MTTQAHEAAFLKAVEMLCWTCKLKPREMLPREIKDCAELAEIDRPTAFRLMKERFKWSNP